MSGKSALKGAAVAALIVATGGTGAAALLAAGTIGTQVAGMSEQHEAGKAQAAVRKRATKRTKKAEALKAKATKESQFAIKARRAERGAGGFTSTQAASLTLGASGRGGKKTLG